MKKLSLLCIGLLSMSFIYAQDLTDALRYSQDNIQGTARFRALSGAFGALGGDMSAVSLNPASSAVFTRSHASFSGSNIDVENISNYFGGLGSTNESNFDLNQAGVAFVFAANNNSPWRKFSLAVAYERTNNFDDSWFAAGTNTTNDPDFSNSIASYFYDFADGKRLDEISTLPGESVADAYRDIGNVYGFSHQQAFLGFESFILEPDDINNDANTTYTSNIASGNFLHDYTYAATGYNGKVSFNLATQYEDNLYLGVNLNTHFIDYQRSTLLLEENNNGGSIDYVEFENNLTTRGNGFSFQIGGIMKLSQEFRVGITYDSPIWYTIEEETSQYLGTDGANGFIEIFPQVVNVYPSYRLQTPARFTGSLAYVFGTQGLISFDYSRKDYGSTKFKPENDSYYQDLNANISDVFTQAATYRLGGEYKHKQFSFRGGYRFEESPYADGITVGDLNGYSLGLGYNFGNTKLDITYDKAERSFNNNLYNLDFGTPPQAMVDRTNSNITISLSFNI
ncbi:OmpP1/FadL family transporter [Seonamhaeicola aphaedonensis]|uniref:Outer membrane protein transport protein (OMPP1/FadL/TodX) n=1 Tax=Seonamhaeicola aphaedonensis TaxID=1461338 RepID=A0A3D9HA65_9FLAO|nr:outer membrane protein transport protein [Seonamhaeicola aphaedonensis]RED46071.1 outer membrane protein transport protein (OMPP1/FadL/TodX) [Seonamhaeicola aphaedonensis]